MIIDSAASRARSGDVAGCPYGGISSIIDWDRIHEFRLPTDGRKVFRPETRQEDVVRGLDNKGYLEDLDLPFTRKNTVTAVDGDGAVVERWPL